MRPRGLDQVSIHGSHQGLRLMPRKQAGHMTASDRQARHAKKTLQTGGHPHMTRPSTRFRSHNYDVDARVEPGHDEE
jgi:hypothetical protein